MNAWTQRLSLGGLPGLGVQAEQTTGAAIDTRDVAVIDAGRDDAQPGTIGDAPGARRAPARSPRGCNADPVDKEIPSCPCSSPC